MINYFKGVISEMKKVEWPTGKELYQLTLTVIGFSAIFALLFLVMDFVIVSIMKAMGI
jgi:preprotein translocase subunit SecE